MHGSSSHLRNRPGVRWLGMGAGGADTYQSLRTGRIFRFYPGPRGGYAYPQRQRGRRRTYRFPDGTQAVVVRGQRVTTIYHSRRPPMQAMGSGAVADELGWALPNVDGTTLALGGVVGLLALGFAARSFGVGSQSASPSVLARVQPQTRTVAMWFDQ
jgi:hypothetical protein